MRVCVRVCVPACLPACLPACVPARGVQVRAEDQPPMDIGMMGKAMQMEMRVVVWDTQDTAPKDG